MLNFSFLERIIEGYVATGFEAENPFVSPLLAPESLLACFPPTLLLCGREDPLHDQSLWFARRLARLEVPVRMVSLSVFGHGFMDLYLPLGPFGSEVRRVVELIAAFLTGQDEIGTGKLSPSDAGDRVETVCPRKSEPLEKEKQ